MYFVINCSCEIFVLNIFKNYSRYSYGKPVKGEVTLTVAPRTRYNKLNVRPYESFQTKAKVMIYYEGEKNSFW